MRATFEMGEAVSSTGQGAALGRFVAEHALTAARRLPCAN